MLGFSGNAKDMSRLVVNTELRQIFVNQAASFVKEHNFDGMDVNWLWPACHNSVSFEERNNDFSSLIFLFRFRLTLEFAMPQKQINLVLPN